MSLTTSLLHLATAPEASKGKSLTHAVSRVMVPFHVELTVNPANRELVPMTAV